MELTVLGGAGEHGRSSYLLTHEQQHLLLDYGVKKEGGGIYPLMDHMEEWIGGLQAVFLSHAHEDHCIALPVLYRHGYKGDVWTTRATVNQLPVYFEAWKRYTDKCAAPRPYDDQDEQRIRYRYLEDIIPAGRWGTLLPGLDVCWGRSGHLPGSIWIALSWKGKRIFFSGDYTSESQLLDADRPMHQARRLSGTPSVQGILPDLDLAIMDAAYGADPELQLNKLAQLKAHMDAALSQGGSVLLPVPLYGRGQELMLWASEQYPDIPVLVESVLLKGIELFADYSGWLHQDALARMERALHYPNLHRIGSDESPADLYEHYGRAIVLVTDGMMQSSIARQHYDWLADEERNTVILTGHLAAGSFGRRMLEQYRMNQSGCAVHYVRYKVHQGLPDVRQMLSDLNDPPTVLVHAPKPKTDSLALRLQQEGFRHIHSLTPSAKLSI
ncbi:MBL fold metallo-hydrolase [Paenibacillus sp. Z6-24]